MASIDGNHAAETNGLLVDIIESRLTAEFRDPNTQSTIDDSRALWRARGQGAGDGCGAGR